MGRIKELSSGVPSASDSFVFDGLKGTKKISLEALERKLIEDGVGNGTLISQINQNVTDMVPSSALLYAMDQAQTEALESVNSSLSGQVKCAVYTCSLSSIPYQSTTSVDITFNLPSGSKVLGATAECMGGVPFVVTSINSLSATGAQMFASSVQSSGTNNRGFWIFVFYV